MRVCQGRRCRQTISLHCDRSRYVVGRATSCFAAHPLTAPSATGMIVVFSGGNPMPLLDHFHPPLWPTHSWESFHSRWAAAIADALDRILPPRYFAEVQVHLGSRVESDVAEFEGPPRDSGNGVPGGAVAVQAWRLRRQRAASQLAPGSAHQHTGVHVGQGCFLGGAHGGSFTPRKTRRDHRSDGAARRRSGQSRAGHCRGCSWSECDPGRATRRVPSPPLRRSHQS